MTHHLPFAEKVAEAMREHGLGLRAVCRELKLDPSFFSKVLAGKRSPPSEEAVLRRLADILGLDPQELIVSTGRIPSEWQPLFKDPSVLQVIRNFASRTTRAATAAPRGAALRSVPLPRRLPPSGREFTDELL
jgi:transcriptional regulator with XRE-family HTH domain